jgi:hypothetical protein
MRKKSVVILTEPSCEDAKEDLLLAKHLSSRFTVVVEKLEAAGKYVADLYMIRNIWVENPLSYPAFRVQEARARRILRDSGALVYNPQVGLGEMQGKDHLVSLFGLGYPVIPSVDTLDEISLLPDSEVYVLKPKDGYSGYGLEFLTSTELLKRDLSGCIIQPKMSFKSEVCFYYIDGNLQYALEFEPSRWPEYPKPREFDPTDEDRLFARQFIQWNRLPYGIQRVDAIRTDKGLMLLELEDSIPCLSLHDISSRSRRAFMGAVTMSIEMLLD